MQAIATVIANVFWGKNANDTSFYFHILDDLILYGFFNLLIFWDYVFKDDIILIFLKAIFHKFYMIHSWMHWLICTHPSGACKKYFRRGGVEGVLKKQTKTGGAGGQAYLHVHSLKNYLIFQIEIRVLSDKLLGSC